MAAVTSCGESDKPSQLLKSVLEVGGGPGGGGEGGRGGGEGNVE